MQKKNLVNQLAEYFVEIFTFFLEWFYMKKHWQYLWFNPKKPQTVGHAHDNG